MADSRKAELERKKAKLQAMREEKERRRKEKEARDAEESSARLPKNEKDLRAETDEMLVDLGILPPGEILSSLASSTTSEQSITTTPDISLHSASFTKTSSKRKTLLSVVNVQQTNIPPKEQVTYNKQTQTATTATEREGSLTATAPFKDFEWWRTKKAQPLDYYDGHFVYPTFEWDDEFPVLVYDDVTGDEDESSLPTMESTAVFTPKLTGMPHVEMVKPALTTGEVVALKAEEKAVEPLELTEEEKHKIMISSNFQRFFDRTSRIIERALYEDMDIFIDYAGGDGEEKDGEDKNGTRLSLNRYFVDDRWSKNRIVTCLDWSTQYPELLVASYDHNEDSPHDPDGVALVWNMKFKKTTPEYIFHCQSSVISATFAKFHPSLIIGGTYSGQIVLWDNRSNKRTPIQRSPLSSTAHTHPIYCVKVVGTQNAHNIVSISTDGKLCTWSLDMLSQPQDTMELQHKQSKAVAVTSLSFPSGDVNNFVVGSEEGTVYAACRHGSKAGVTDVFEGHQGPITGIDTFSAHGQMDFSHLFLTSSFDWTVKLWSLKENKPLHSFEDYGDYVYDVRWSPVHPALFATVDGTGRIDIWNLNIDTEAPTASISVDSNVALNRVSWSQSGHHVIAGDDQGKVWVYEVGEQLAIPKSDEWTKMAHTLQELKNNQADDEDVFNKSVFAGGMPIR